MAHNDQPKGIGNVIAIGRRVGSAHIRHCGSWYVILSQCNSAALSVYYPLTVAEQCFSIPARELPCLSSEQPVSLKE